MEDAKDLIDYLTPDPEKGRHLGYYNPKPEAKGGLFRWLWDRLLEAILGQEGATPAVVDWRTIEIEGSVSLMALKEKTIHSHYGHYGDGWVTIHLEGYM